MIHENLIRQALLELDITADVFSMISGFSAPRLSRAFRGKEDFSGPEVLTLNELIEHMRGIAREASPLPISFRNPKIVKDLIEKRRRGLRIIPIFLGPADVVQE